MGYIYTISTFIRADSIPDRATLESVISDHFYLFQVYDRNPYIVRAYMNFIDANFDYCLSKLGYEMIRYEYPDELDYSDSVIINYINYNYNLNSYNKLDTYHRVNKEDIYDIVSNSYVTIYFNDYACYDTSLNQYGILNFIENDTIENSLVIIRYLNNKRLSDLLTNLIIHFTDYITTINFDEIDSIDEYSESMNHSIIVLYQLKNYMNILLEERRDKNNDTLYL